MRISDWSSYVCSSDLIGRGGRERVFRKLLDAEADALLLDIDIEHAGADDVALLEILDRFLARLVPRQVRQVDHAVDVARQPDEQAELGDVPDLALELRALRVAGGDVGPRILLGLLVAERDPPTGRASCRERECT